MGASLGVSGSIWGWYIHVGIRCKVHIYMYIYIHVPAQWIVVQTPTLAIPAAQLVSVADPDSRQRIKCYARVSNNIM